MLKVEVKGLNSCINKLEKIINRLTHSVGNGVEIALSDTQSAVIASKNKSIEYPDQILDSEIKTQLQSDKLEGRVYTDGERVLFVEYGTGTEAEMPHIGKTKTFLNSNFSMWLLPVEKAPIDYGVSRRIKIGHSEFYVMLPTTPKHFVSNTAFNRRDSNIEVIKSEIIKMLKENTT